MRKRSMLVAMAVGAAAAYLLDLDNGRARRARAKDQAAASLRSMKEQTSAQARYQRNVMEGWVHETKSAMRPPRNYDDDTLVQKVKSEVLGSWAAQGHPAVEAEASSGTVTLIGNIADRGTQEDLQQRVLRVEGVKDVRLRTNQSVPE